MRFNNFSDTGHGNEVFDDGLTIDKVSKLTIDGNNNHVRFGAGCTFKNASILIRGSGISLDFDDHVFFGGGFIDLKHDGSSLNVGRGTIFNHSYIYAWEGRKVSIGMGCLFARNVYFRTSDLHSIFDIETGDRVNSGKDVLVGPRVWVGEGGILEKGSHVPEGSIIGARSIVTKKLPRKNSIYVGGPVRLVREGVRWDIKVEAPTTLGVPAASEQEEDIESLHK